MIYLYRKQASEGATDLADALNDSNIPARRTQGGLLREQRILDRLRAGRDRLISWGDYLPNLTGLNNVPLQSKYQDALKLKEAGVATIEVSRTRPVPQPVERFYPLFQQAQAAYNRAIDDNEVRRLIGELEAHLATPLPPSETWLGRRNNHIGGLDLLTPPQAPDYWSRKEPIVAEYRLHVFRGKSIRAGQKVRREFRPDGITPSHDWIRSFDAGWIIAYENFKSTKEQRKIAADAVAALGLDFGAVDLAQKADGGLLVLEVNRAPGVEGGTIQAYVGAIQRWVQGGE